MGLVSWYTTSRRSRSLGGVGSSGVLGELGFRRVFVSLQTHTADGTDHATVPICAVYKCSAFRTWSRYVVSCLPAGLPVCLSLSPSLCLVLLFTVLLHDRELYVTYVRQPRVYIISGRVWPSGLGSCLVSKS